MLKRLNLSLISSKMISLRRTIKHQMIKSKEGKLIRFVLLKLVISKLFRLGFNFTSYFEYCRGNHCKEGMVIPITCLKTTSKTSWSINHAKEGIFMLNEVLKNDSNDLISNMKETVDVIIPS
jgi:hypothetical protein